MSFATAVLTYQDAVAALPTGRKHILLGNGFSIACDPVFRYASLYDAAISAGLSARAQSVFQRIGTNNFEGVMRLLEDAQWVAEAYGLLDAGDSEILRDVEIVKRTLVEAVASSHLPHTGSLSDEKKLAAKAFLEPYYNVFTTNYDLLPYWVNMSIPAGAIWGDGFRADAEVPDAPYVVFTERLGSDRGLFYLHGALHLYIALGELRKHTWSRTGIPLTRLIAAGLSEGSYPLFVAEGTGEKKLEQIQRSGYLWYALDKFARLKGPLVVFGHSLGDSDGHIANGIADNGDLRQVLVGLHGDPKSAANQAIYASTLRMTARRQQLAKRRSRTKPLEFVFYDSAKPSLGARSSTTQTVGPLPL